MTNGKLRNNKHIFQRLLLAGAVMLSPAWSSAQGESISSLAELGELLFHDTNLSLTRSQSCATCHDPARAFIDPRDNSVNGAVSLGDDGRSLGVRNSPTLTYAALIPDFQRLADGDYMGGQFLDGRARHLRQQVNLNGGPLLNPAEMMMPDRAAVIARIRENPAYEEAYRTFFGENIFASPRSDNFPFTRIGQAIASFEDTDTFATFDSRYDSYLRGELELSDKETRGLLLFRQHCSHCHSAAGIHDSRRETFTNYRYYNIGVPINHQLRAARGDNAPDPGLLGNPIVNEERHAGKFRTPGLRNVAVTAPYMHNGVVNTLQAAIQLHLHRAADSQSPFPRNPETGLPWQDTDYPATIASYELVQSSPLSAADINILIRFLETLTDERYEHLLP